MNENGSKKYFEEKAKAIKAYYAITNNVLGMLGISSAFACVSTKNPIQFSIIALIFIFISWGLGVFNLLQTINELKAANHPSTFFMSNVLNTLPAIFGALILAFVATGHFNEFGFCLNSCVPQK